MATLTTQDGRPVGGTTLTMTAASGGGDRAQVGDGYYLLVHNASASSVTVTLDSTGQTFNAQDVPDTAVAVAAGGIALVPLTRHYLSDTDGLAGISYSSATSVTVAAVRA